MQTMHAAMNQTLIVGCHEQQKRRKIVKTIESYYFSFS